MNNITNVHLHLFLIAFLCLVANVIAIVYQFLYHELPCPLCLFQRYGLLASGIGAIMGLYGFKISKSHTVIILSCLYTMAVGMRQVFLHISPPDAGYGSSFLGMHFYSWSVIFSFGLILVIACYSTINYKYAIPNLLKTTTRKTLSISYIVIIIINIVAVYFECALKQCPDNPTQYLILHKHKK